jgi:hypothetical protein
MYEVACNHGIATTRCALMSKKLPTQYGASIRKSFHSRRYVLTYKFHTACRSQYPASNPKLSKRSFYSNHLNHQYLLRSVLVVFYVGASILQGFEEGTFINGVLVCATLRR